MTEIQLFKRTAPGAAAMPQPETGAAALARAEARGDVVPGETMFAHGAPAKRLLAVLLLHLQHGTAYISPRHASRPLGAGLAEIERTLRDWGEAGFVRLYRQIGGDEIAVLFPDASEEWRFGWRSIGAALSLAEREVRAGGPLSEVFDLETVERLFREWGIARTAPGESGEIIDIDAVPLAGVIG
jgi:hypothetical protein